MTQTIRPTVGDSSWFVHDRFGMFIHWGLYSLAARHEWVKSKERISDEEYDRKYFKHFDPDLYNPELWAKAASDAGMKYFVVTTKHHEGFCLWDSKLTDYKSTKTAAGRDLLRPMVDAFRRQNMRVGLYHSLIDWHHPQYWVDCQNHPRRGELTIDEKPDGMFDQAGGSAAGSAAKKADINAGKDQNKYADYLHGQVRELLSEFGQVDIMWFDFSFVNGEHRLDFAKGKGREAWRSEELVKLIRKLQPKILLDNRLDLDIPEAWDFLTPEQTQPRGWVEHQGQRVVWEACQTFSGSWGYYRDEHSWRSVKQLLSTLIDCVSKGGNLLLNVGPTGRGEIDERAMDRLSGMGQWMRRHSRSIYGCTQAPAEFAVPQDCRLTFNPTTNRLYVHLLNWPYQHLHLDGKAYMDRVEYAQFLHDASEVRMRVSPWHANQMGGPSEKVTLVLPQMEPLGTQVPVIELFLK